MAAVLVDYENVASLNGLEGAEFLTETDSIHIFYGADRRIRADYFTAIKDSGCRSSICHLLNPRKNALDFYIASECGVLFRGGEREFLIVTRDKGLRSIADYFRSRKHDAQVLTAPNIALGLMQFDGPGNEERRERIRRRMEMLDLEEQFGAIEESSRFMEGVRKSFSGTELEGLIPAIPDWFAEHRNDAPGPSTASCCMPLAAVQETGCIRSSSG